MINSKMNEAYVWIWLPGALEPIIDGKLEINENNDTITLKSLRKVATALDCKLVYAFIPNEQSLEKLITKQAIKKAKELIDPVDHTMMLEGQKVGNKNDKIKEIANDLIQNLNSKMWD